MSDEVAGARAPCPHCGEEHPASALKCPSTDLVLPLEGRVLAGRFSLVRELGTGGMASVWLALNTAVDRLVAIKLIRPEVVRREETVARFRSEARAAGRIEHPNICQIHDFGSSPIGPYMVMEYLRGQNLAELLAGQRTLSVGVTTGLMHQALSGLSAAHREGIVHRDLKPENVFVHVPENGPARIKLMDFGVSKLTDGSGEIQTEHGALLGTPEYMAPEQVGGSESVDARCDLWAVGAMLYRALTGRLPFKGPTIAATLLELTNTEPRAIESLAPHVPEALCELVMSCMSKDREGRPADADALAAALEQWAEPVDLASLVEGGDGSGDGSGDGTREAAVSGDAGPSRRGRHRGATLRAPRDPAQEGSQEEPQEGQQEGQQEGSPDDGSPADSGARATLPRAPKGLRRQAVSEYPTVKRGKHGAEDDEAADADADGDDGVGLGEAVGTVARLAAEARALRKADDHEERAPLPGADSDEATAPRSTESIHDEEGTPRWALIAVVLLALAAVAWWWSRPGPPRDAPPQPSPVAKKADPATHGAGTGAAPAVQPTSAAAGSTGARDDAASDTEELIVMIEETDTGAATAGGDSRGDTGGDSGGDSGGSGGDDGTSGGASAGGNTGRTSSGKRPRTSGGGSEPADPGPDPGGTFRVGSFLVLKRPGPVSTHSEARKYCKGLAAASHVGVSKWTLPNPAAAKLIGGSRRLKTGRYWTSARYQGRAKVLSLPRGELDSEKVDKKRVKALCVARVPRPSSD